MSDCLPFLPRMDALRGKMCGDALKLVPLVEYLQAHIFEARAQLQQNLAAKENHRRRKEVMLKEQQRQVAARNAAEAAAAQVGFLQLHVVKVLSLESGSSGRLCAHQRAGDAVHSTELDASFTRMRMRDSAGTEAGGFISGCGSRGLLARARRVQGKLCNSAQPSRQPPFWQDECRSTVNRMQKSICMEKMGICVHDELPGHVTHWYVFNNHNHS